MKSAYKKPFTKVLTISCNSEVKLYLLATNARITEVVSKNLLESAIPCHDAEVVGPYYNDDHESLVSLQ